MLNHIVRLLNWIVNHVAFKVVSTSVISKIILKKMNKCKQLPIYKEQALVSYSFLLVILRGFCLHGWVHHSLCFLQCTDVFCLPTI